MKKKLLKIFLSCVFYLSFCLGASLTVLANVGTASINAFSLTLTDISSIKAGTFIASINIFFALIFIFLTKFKYKLLSLIQIFAFILFGIILNFFVYNVFSFIPSESYILRIFILIIGLLIATFSIGVVTVLRVITFPIETFCQQLEITKSISFIKSRYIIDFIFIFFAIILSFLFKTPSYVREGTIITMILNSYLVTLSKTYAERNFSKILKN